MAAVWYRFRAELRTRWKTVLALALLAGIAGAVTLAAVAGARRTDSAFARMLRETRAADLLVNPDFGNESALDARAVSALPMVAEAGKERGITVIAVGRWAWTTLADDLGTVAEPIVPALAMLLAVPVVLLIANVVAFAPGRIAARLRPAAVLRSE